MCLYVMGRRPVARVRHIKRLIGQFVVFQGVFPFNFFGVSEL